ncbi:hypothetical protein A0H81_12334 [Grifola frondosa]|uniref:Uncharacterized protein n=1 Tax=Grifola frondosa TaxID=5627 RepID=A0A1C7LT17_GRIFR|nr:hypothetical protein A0H81_12334 [Grifola frondosa]
MAALVSVENRPLAGLSVEFPPCYSLERARSKLTARFFVINIFMRGFMSSLRNSLQGAPQVRTSRIALGGYGWDASKTTVCRRYMSISRSIQYGPPT